MNITETSTVQEPTQGYVPLEQIIREVCFEEGDQGLHKYQRFEHFGLEAIQQFTQYYSNEIKTVSLASDNKGTIGFPDDFMLWTKVGIQRQDRVEVMSVNPKLHSYYSLDNCGQAVKREDYKPDYAPGFNENYYSDEGSFPFYNFWSGINMGTIYGYGNGYQNEGAFKVDWEGRRFVFSSAYVNTTILIEYKTNGKNPSGATLVPELARRAIKLWIRWQDASTRKNSTEAEIFRKKNEYYREATISSLQMKDLSVDGILDAYRQTLYLAPKIG